jgi:hypothetical protein
MIFSTLLFVHICGASVGLLSGTGAMFFRKGSGAHRTAGKVFVVAMLLMSSSASVMAFMHSQFTNLVVGILTFYLVGSGRLAATRGDQKFGILEKAACGLAFVDGSVAIFYALTSAKVLAAAKDDPIGAIFFGCVALLGAGLDLRMFLRGGVAGKRRTARHLWRMCAALLITIVSFFLGKQKLFPHWLQGSPVLFLPPLLTLLALVYWMVRVYFPAWFRANPPLRAGIAEQSPRQIYRAQENT